MIRTWVKAMTEASNLTNLRTSGERDCVKLHVTQRNRNRIVAVSFCILHSGPHSVKANYCSRRAKSSTATYAKGTRRTQRNRPARLGKSSLRHASEGGERRFAC